MPRTLRQIKFVDLAHSKLDDGGVADLRRMRGELLYDIKLAQKTPAPKRTDGQKAELVTLKNELRDTQAKLSKSEEAAIKDFKLGIKEGHIRFRKKVLIDYRGIKAPRPKHYLKWCRYDASNNFREFRDWKASRQWSPVISGRDPYWPDGLAPDSKGYYVRGDLIMMKVNMKDYLLQRWEDIQRANNAPADTIAKFKSDVERSGGDVPDEIINKIMGEFDKKFKRGELSVPV